MAIQTYQIASFENGLAYAEIDVNDVNLRVMVARLVNNTDKSIGVTLTKGGNTVIHQVVMSGQTFSLNPPASIRFAMDAGDPVWSIPPAMTMGDIQIFVGNGEVY